MTATAQTLREKFSFTSSIAADVWSPKPNSKAYEWWYFDALSDDGRDAVVRFLLSFKDLRLESIMELDEIVVAAHSFSAARAIATTAYAFRDELVVSAKCADVRRVRA